jgi:hypothetical protein
MSNSNGNSNGNQSTRIREIQTISRIAVKLCLRSPDEESGEYFKQLQRLSID